MKLKPRTFAFLSVFAAVTYPLLFPLNISDRVSPEAVKFKALVDSLPAGSVVDLAALDRVEAAGRSCNGD